MLTLITRRGALRAAFPIATARDASTRQAEQQRRATVADLAGPSYPIVRALDTDADLTRIAGRPGRAQGAVFDLRGRVINTLSRPVAGALVEMWQANTHGRYAHGSDGNLDAALDPGFQGFGKQTTDAQGRFRFLSVVPGRYPVAHPAGTWLRTPHVHFAIRGKHDRLLTQIYFEGEPGNDTDLHYQTLSAEDQQTVTIRLHNATGKALAPRYGEWTVVLPTG